MSNRKSLFPCLVVGGMLLAVAVSVVGWAQQPAKAQTDDQHVNISERDLTAFVKAYVENQNIRLEYEPALRNSTDAETRREIQDRANEELQKSLSKQSLSVEKYDTIYRRVKQRRGVAREGAGARRGRAKTVVLAGVAPDAQ